MQIKEIVDFDDFEEALEELGCSLDGSIRPMKIELSPRHQRYIEDKVTSVAYGSPDEVATANSRRTGRR